MVSLLQVALAVLEFEPVQFITEAAIALCTLGLLVDTSPSFLSLRIAELCALLLNIFIYMQGGTLPGIFQRSDSYGGKSCALVPSSGVIVITRGFLHFLHRYKIKIYFLPLSLNTHI